ncbi:DNA-binding MarR family transcriptional regulator [Streptosporangium becharense]|uniref:DNA-binding MarR family transcriptional regulator n=1 Tax=Streptosporangium becharense TaxID=1816182 RepID=A0A7W9ING9_9ACTN|nr:MarR family transcriptional regulator [Streptosporangium becharense]MBB2914402.1 DNA-binding MarR family transcriptional regulator [Streptosporangium becharense]MBB5823566.1 DNA-binding MarR family transcriptional regulator [Streptosporangium becharense]
MNDERERLIDQIGEIQRDLGRLIVRHRPTSPLFDSSLTLRQLKVVMILACQGSASGQDLAHHLGVGLGTVTGIVDRLVGHGLVTRREDPHDRRIRRVELTPAGRTLIEEISDAGLTDFRHLLQRLDTPTLHGLSTAMDKIRQVAETLYNDTPNKTSDNPITQPPE